MQHPLLVCIGFLLVLTLNGSHRMQLCTVSFHVAFVPRWLLRMRGDETQYRTESAVGCMYKHPFVCI
jgi:hypothetical protein